MPDAPNFALPGLLEIDRPILESRRTLIHLAAKSVQDSHWLGLPSVGPITPGGVQPTYPLARVAMRFGVHLPVENPALVGFASDDEEPSIIITDAVTWEFNIPKRPLDLPYGYYYWEIETTDSEGEAHVYYAGDQMITD